MAVDFHIHSSFSGDSDAPMEQMIQEGLKKGLRTMCFTEHMDMDYPEEAGVFEVDTGSYHEKFLQMKEKYQDQIELLFGIELGLQPHLAEQHRKYLSEWPFDFVIGSSHVVHGKDPYFPAFYEGKTESQAYLEYFESILENLAVFDEMDVYGHIDYVVRYGPNKNQHYTYEAYREVLDEILKTLIRKDVGLELNTAGYKYGLGHPNPTEAILKRYMELGGEILTIGCDGHAPEQLAWDFEKIPALLKECGFRYYTVFEERMPVFYPVETF